MRADERALLLEHIDGAVPINVQDVERSAVMRSCTGRGWLRLGARGSEAIRPKLSYITDEGRAALCKELARWADVLIERAHRRDALLARLLNEAGKVPEAEYFGEADYFPLIQRPLDPRDRKLLRDDIARVDAGDALSRET